MPAWITATAVNDCSSCNLPSIANVSSNALACIRCCSSLRPFNCMSCPQCLQRVGGSVDETVTLLLIPGYGIKAQRKQAGINVEASPELALTDRMQLLVVLPT